MQTARILELPLAEKNGVGQQSLAPELRQRLAERILAAAQNNRLPCAGAFAIAESLGVSSRQVGEVADTMRIKIARCQLGCF